MSNPSSYQKLVKLGRRKKWQSVEELEKRIEEYFAETSEFDVTITGLALYLGTTRQTLVDYGKDDEFAGLIKQAKLCVENAYERDLRRRGRSGDIFALKNFGWKDERKTDITSAGERIQPGVIESKAADILEEDENQ